MAEFEEKLNSILSNPALMGQIMSMAGSLGQTQPQTPPPQQPPEPPKSQPCAGGLPFDPAAMQGMLALLKSTQIDQRQQNLLCALQGFLPDDRLQKLTKAMQAAKIARYASSALSQGR